LKLATESSSILEVNVWSGVLVTANQVRKRINFILAESFCGSLWLRIFHVRKSEFVGARIVSHGVIIPELRIIMGAKVTSIIEQGEEA
jgi:hypothetical protein